MKNEKKITIKIIDEEKEDVCFNIFIDKDLKVAEVIGAEAFDPETSSKEQNFVYSLILPDGLMKRYESEKINKEDSLNVFCHKHAGLYPGLPENKSVAIHEKQYRELLAIVSLAYECDTEDNEPVDNGGFRGIGESICRYFGFL